MALKVGVLSAIEKEAITAGAKEGKDHAAIAAGINRSPAVVEKYLANNKPSKNGKGFSKPKAKPALPTAAATPAKRGPKPKNTEAQAPEAEEEAPKPAAKRGPKPRTHDNSGSVDHTVRLHVEVVLSVRVA